MCSEDHPLPCSPPRSWLPGPPHFGVRRWPDVLFAPHMSFRPCSSSPLPPVNTQRALVLLFSYTTSPSPNFIVFQPPGHFLPVRLWSWFADVLKPWHHPEWLLSPSKVQGSLTTQSFFLHRKWHLFHATSTTHGPLLSLTQCFSASTITSQIFPCWPFLEVCSVLQHFQVHWLLGSFPTLSPFPVFYFPL